MSRYGGVTATATKLHPGLTVEFGCPRVKLRRIATQIYKRKL